MLTPRLRVDVGHRSGPDDSFYDEYENDCHYDPGHYGARDRLREWIEWIHDLRPLPFASGKAGCLCDLRRLQKRKLSTILVGYCKHPGGSGYGGGWIPLN